MPIIFLLQWLEEPENFDSCTEKCCPPIMRGSVAESSLLNRRPPASAERQSAEAFVDCTCLVQTGDRPTT